MLIYFSAPQLGKKYFEEYYRKIYKEIERLGYIHLDDEIIKIKAKEYLERFEDGSKSYHSQLYKKNIGLLQKADINVFDCSFDSLSIGFMIEKSLEYGKPTIVLYLKDNLPFFLVGANDEKLVLRSYNERNLHNVITKSLDEAKIRRDKRFNFFISQELLAFLEQESTRQSTTKSTFIRNLIIDYRKKLNGKGKYT